MKKILGISLVALFAVSPMMANAATGEIINTNPVNINNTDNGAAAQQADAVTTSVAPKWKLAVESDNDVNAASAGYVKGAYNAAMKAINYVHGEVADLSSGAVQSAGTGLTKDGTTISLSEASQSSLAKADTALQSAGTGLTADGTTISLSAATQSSLAKADTALQSHQTIITGSENGTISVAGSDVAVKGLGTAAYTDSSAYDAAGAATNAAASALASAITAINSATGSASSVSLGVSIDSQTIPASGLTVSVPTTASYNIMQEWGSDSATSATYALGGDSSVNVAGSATLAAFSTVASGDISGIKISYTAN